MGQQWHIQTTRVNLMVQGHRVKEIKPLNEQEAIQSGAELLTEGFVLSVAVWALIAETKRSARANEEKAKQKEARRVAKQQALKAQLDDVHETLKECVEYSLAMKNALEASKPFVKNLPNIPPNLQKLIDEGGVSSMLVNNKKVDDNNKTEKKPESQSVWESVFHTVSTNGITAGIKWIGSLINDGEEGEGVSISIGEEDDD